MTSGIFPGPRHGALHVLGGLGFRAAVVSASVFGHAAVLAVLFSNEPAAVDTGSVIVVELVAADDAAPPTPPEETERVSIGPTRITRSDSEPDKPAPLALPLRDAHPPSKPPVPEPLARATRHVEPNPSPAPPGAPAPKPENPAASPAPDSSSWRPSPPGEAVSAPPAVLAPPAMLAPPAEEALAPSAVPATPLAGNPKPDYPAEALRRGIGGRVVLSIAVGAGGEVEQASVIATSGHAALDAAALVAVRAWRFRPARRLGVAVSSEARVPFVFRIHDDGR